MLKIKNHTGYYFPVCSDIIQSKLSECGFCPTHIEIALYGQNFVISICGENNTGLRAYTVSKEDYSRIIKEVMQVNQAYFGEISERDIARGYEFEQKTFQDVEDTCSVILRCKTQLFRLLSAAVNSVVLSYSTS